LNKLSREDGLTDSRYDCRAGSMASSQILDYNVEVRRKEQKKEIWSPMNAS
jgi:ribosomal protein L21E